MNSNVLDSRSIGLGDAFGQRFMKEGTYRYNLVRPGGGRMVDEFPYDIVVKGQGQDGELQQETVLVQGKEHAVFTERRELEIRAGDLVVWAPASGDVPRFEIVGERDFFGSSTLRNECGYSHAFGLAGDYAWRDAYGGKASGVVRVKEPKVGSQADLDRWKRKLANAQLVMINDGKVEPAEVVIEMGQTVYFAIVNGKGISVTDEQLLRAGGHDIEVPDKVPTKPKKQPAKKQPAKKRTAKKAAARKPK